jgi:hypothetical protein
MFIRIFIVFTIGWFIGEWYVTPYVMEHFFISPITLEEGKQ